MLLSDWSSDVCSSDLPDRLLLPGMFADVAVVAGPAREVVIVPRTAVTYILYGDSVYVVGSDATDEDGALIVERRFVRTGDTRQDRVAITEGVRVGERVVTSGQLKLQPGGHVKVDETAGLTPPPVRPKE